MPQLTHEELLSRVRSLAEQEFNVSGSYGPAHPPDPAYRHPDRLDEKGLASALRGVLAGTPADGSPPPAKAPSTVIWVDRGDEVLVHLDSIHTRSLDGRLLVSIELETDQTGRTPLVVTLALGMPGDPAGLVAVGERYPRGNAVLASRWGEAVQTAVWSGLLSLSQAHASERNQAPRGISAMKGMVQFSAGSALVAK